jgi:hypothetical protein
MTTVRTRIRSGTAAAAGKLHATGGNVRMGAVPVDLWKCHDTGDNAMRFAECGECHATPILKTTP